jgi:hypothetical protein
MIQKQIFGQVLTARTLCSKETGCTLGNLECQTETERQEYKEKRGRRRRTVMRCEREPEAHGNPKFEHGHAK